MPASLTTLGVLWQSRFKSACLMWSRSWGSNLNQKLLPSSSCKCHILTFTYVVCINDSVLEEYCCHRACWCAVGIVAEFFDYAFNEADLKDISRVWLTGSSFLQARMLSSAFCLVFWSRKNLDGKWTLTDLLGLFQELSEIWESIHYWF